MNKPKFAFGEVVVVKHGAYWVPGKVVAVKIEERLYKYNVMLLHYTNTAGNPVMNGHKEKNIFRESELFNALTQTTEENMEEKNHE